MWDDLRCKHVSISCVRVFVGMWACMWACMCLCVCVCAFFMVHFRTCLKHKCNLQNPLRFPSTVFSCKPLSEETHFNTHSEGITKTFTSAQTLHIFMSCVCFLCCFLLYSLRVSLYMPLHHHQGTKSLTKPSFHHLSPLQLNSHSRLISECDGWIDS